jgi:hypothetical protein
MWCMPTGSQQKIVFYLIKKEEQLVVHRVSQGGGKSFRELGLCLALPHGALVWVKPSRMSPPLRVKWGLEGLFFSILDVTHTSSSTKRNLAKFGYRTERTSKNCAILWGPPQNLFVLNMAISNFFLMHSFPQESFVCV